MNLTTTNDLRQLGTILFVGAHPDDETFTAGAILAAAAANSQRVVCLTATRGEVGVQDEARWPADKLADIRTAESEAAFRELGLKEHKWLDYADYKCASVDEQDAATALGHVLDEVRPDSILTFGPDGLTGHPDHQSMSRWVSLATAGREIAVYHVVHDPVHYQNVLKAHDEQFNMYFNTPQPPLKPEAECDIAFHAPDEFLIKKVLALKAMPSQYEIMLKGLGGDDLKDLFGLECFVKA